MPTLTNDDIDFDETLSRKPPVHICTRVISVTGKCSDMFTATMGSIVWEGDIPPELKIGSGNWITFSYCADCGKIQSTFPLPNDIGHPEDEA